MKITNAFIFDVINHRSDINTTHRQDLSKDIADVFHHQCHEVITRIKSHIIYPNEISDDVLKSDLQTYIIASSCYLKRSSVKHIIDSSTYADSQKDIYYSIFLFYCPILQLDSGFLKPNPGSFHEYVAKFRWMTKQKQIKLLKNISPTYQLDQLLSGMFNYNSDTDVVINDKVYEDLLYHLDTMKLSEKEVYFRSNRFYIPDHELPYYQTWDVFMSVVNTQIKYVLFENVKYFKEMHKYFNVEDINRLPDVQVYDYFIRDISETTLQEVKALAPAYLQSTIHQMVVDKLHNRRTELMKALQDIQKQLKVVDDKLVSV